MYTLINLKFVITYLLAYEDGTECSETSAYKIQTPGNYPEENIQHSEHGKSLKSRILTVLLTVVIITYFRNYTTSYSRD